MRIFRGHQIFFRIFFLVLAFETIDTQMSFWEVFLKMHEKKVINFIGK